MKRMLFLAFIVSLVFVLPLQAQQTVRLYPENKIPFAKAGTEIPQLTIYEPTGKRTTIAVIVCSGGSYGGRANDWEGIPACKKLAEAGITAFLLDYRVPRADRMENKQWVPLADLQTAIAYVREHAKQYKVSNSQVGIMGFSAGGHLVTTAGTHFEKPVLPDANKTSVRPDFVVAVYPVVSFADSLTHKDSRNNLIGPDLSSENIRLYSNELQVTARTPPTYLVTALDDDVVPAGNSLYLSAALQQYNIPTELYLYANGGHGFGIHNKTAQEQWIDSCLKWIFSHFLTK